jgi:diguanylate cyclase (GGDEF)-like protein
MQLERFNQFISEIRNDDLIGAGCVSFAAFHFFNAKWFDADNDVLDDAELIRDLNFTRRRRIDWRQKGSLNSYFIIKEFDAVIEIQFSKPANSRTRQRYAGHLQRCLRNSKNAFDATHDTLTGLLNRSGFESKLNSIARPVLKEVAEVKGKSSTLQAVAIVGLFSLDIDHFKQINDSYGHQYGDIVLKCFARRLLKKVDEISQNSMGKLRLTVSRPGGEEFSVLVEGAQSVEELIDLAEQFRSAICEQHLPTDQELLELKEEYEGPVPSATERRISASVGVSNVNLNATDGISKPMIGRLIHCADTALYRAKVGGRNLVRNFSDIIARYGRVLEHHQDTAVVTIDIGSLVGVSIGQEFLVYHPDFSGGVPFMFRDGRTQKRLGDYPRVPCGRIVVFNVQPEISFCKVAQRDCPAHFVNGALLEEIPIGSLPHLLAFDGQATSAGPDLVSAEKLPDAVVTIVQNDSKPFVAVIGIKDVPEVIAKRGQVFINQCIMKMYQVVREKFGFHASLGQVQASSLAVVLSCESDSGPNKKKVEEIVSTLNEKLGGQASFVAGVFDPNIIDERGSNFDLKAAIDFARFAVHDEEKDTLDGVQVFDGRVASSVVYESRRNRSYQAGLTDYYWFVEHGVKNEFLENNGALCEIEKSEPDLDAALAAINRAISINGKDPDFFANKGYIEFFRDDLQSTLVCYRKCWEVNKDFKLANVYVPSYVLSLANWVRTEVVSDDNVKKVVTKIDEAIKLATNANWMHYLSKLKLAKQAILKDQRFSKLFA